MRIVVLGGGFGGVTTARHLERVLRRHRDAEITLVSRENFFVLTPLLFEACSGRLELRHCAQPIRVALRRTRFIEAAVEAVDVERRLVRAVSPDGATYDLPYDHLVVALGASTNEQLIPGSLHEALDRYEESIRSHNVRPGSMHLAPCAWLGSSVSSWPTTTSRSTPSTTTPARRWPPAECRTRA